MHLRCSLTLACRLETKSSATAINWPSSIGEQPHDFPQIDAEVDGTARLSRPKIKRIGACVNLGEMTVVTVRAC